MGKRYAVCVGELCEWSIQYLNIDQLRGWYSVQMLPVSEGAPVGSCQESLVDSFKRCSTILLTARSVVLIWLTNRRVLPWHPACNVSAFMGMRISTEPSVLAAHPLQFLKSGWSATKRTSG
jgi:hypothetical protein